MAREEIDCHGRAAVAIEPVSADSLRKTGIFADLAGDFRRFLLQLRPNWESGEDDARKAGFFRPILGCVRKPVRTLHCLAGAGGSEPPNSRIEMPYCFSTLVSRRPTASRHLRPYALQIRRVQRATRLRVLMRQHQSNPAPLLGSGRRQLAGGCGSSLETPKRFFTCSRNFWNVT